MSDPDPDATEAAGAQPDSRPPDADSVRSGAAAPDSEPATPSIAEQAQAADLAEAEAAAKTASTAKRPRPIVAVALLAVAAALLWGSSRMNWARIEITSDYGLPRHRELNGGVWFGALTPLALVFLATIAAVFATHGWWRRGVGVVVAVLAAVSAVPGYALLMHKGTTDRATRLAELHGGDHAGAVTTSTLPAVVALAGAVAAFVAGLLLVRQSSGTTRMSGKYDSPAARKLSAAEQVAAHHARVRDPESGSHPAADTQLSGRVLWDALDEGVDPTDDETNRPAAHDDPGNGTARDNRP
ncbi:TIGR02234 family membrane protein [Nocardia niigatensis]|uniref:TIGR02234 family membrane protein n=1 Tax=Nocardia niigatensis TaxID=209249 RepID=UPI0002F1236A|nr:TIGR02234 family membrane protein [Nocardia niigatensis]